MKSNMYHWHNSLIVLTKEIDIYSMQQIFWATFENLFLTEIAYLMRRQNIIHSPLPQVTEYVGIYFVIGNMKHYFPTLIESISQHQHWPDAQIIDLNIKNTLVTKRIKQFNEKIDRLQKEKKALLKKKRASAKQWNSFEQSAFTVFKQSRQKISSLMENILFGPPAKSVKKTNNPHANTIKDLYKI